MRDSIFSPAAWAAFGVGSAPEPESEDASIWPFVLLSVIVILSTVFDCGKEMVEHSTPETFQPIVEAFFSELATLGFIGALAFLLTYNFSSSCEGPCSIMQQMSEHFLGEPDELQEIFEKLHFLLFAVSVVFIAVVLVLLRISLRSSKSWVAWEDDMNKANEDVKTKTAIFESNNDPMKARSAMLESVSKVQALMSDKPVVRDSRRWWNAPDSLWFEWMKPTAQRQAEYYRIRHRFVDDEDEIVETRMDPDFNFCEYLKTSLAHTFAEVIEIKPVDWLVLWLGFAVVFALYFLEPTWTVWSFVVCELLILALCVTVQAKLVRIRYHLLPAVDHHSTHQASYQDLGPLQDEDAYSETSPLIGREKSTPPCLLGGDSPPPASRERSALDLIPKMDETGFEGKGATSQQLMEGFGAGPALHSPSSSPPPSAAQGMASPVQESSHPRGDPPALTGQPPKPSYREHMHHVHAPTARRGSNGDAGVSGLASPRRLSSEQAAPVRELRSMSVESAHSDRRSPTRMGASVVSMPPPRSGSNDSSSGAAQLQSLNSGKLGTMTAKTKIILARPLYTTLPSAASIRHPSSPAKQASRRNVHHGGNLSLQRQNSHHEDEEESMGHALSRFFATVFCCFSCCWGHHKMPTKHHSLFWFGIRGKAFMIHMVKLLLFSSVISLAVIAVELRTELAETSVILLFLAILPPAMTLIMTPRNLQLLNLVTSIEIMKKEELIVEVIKTQRYMKQRKVMQILSSLQFFLDQAEALTDTKSSTPKDVMYQFKKLQRDKATKSHLKDLKELFDYYDDDDSGSIDKKELGDLLAQMGQQKSPDEVERLFTLMDADQSNSVEFHEFAVVIMANRKSKRNMDPFALADRMWKLFDENGDGSIECNELSDTLKRLGQNWNTEDIDNFFRDIDKDGSGAIEKHEFVDFIIENLGGRHKKGAH